MFSTYKNLPVLEGKFLYAYADRPRNLQGLNEGNGHLGPASYVDGQHMHATFTLQDKYFFSRAEHTTSAKVHVHRKLKGGWSTWESAAFCME